MGLFGIFDLFLGVGASLVELNKKGLIEDHNRDFAIANNLKTYTDMNGKTRATANGRVVRYEKFSNGNCGYIYVDTGNIYYLTDDVVSRKNKEHEEWKRHSAERKEWAISRNHLYYDGFVVDKKNYDLLQSPFYMKKLRILDDVPVRIYKDFMHEEKTNLYLGLARVINIDDLTLNNEKSINYIADLYKTHCHFISSSVEGIRNNKLFRLEDTSYEERLAFAKRLKAPLTIPTVEEFIKQYTTDSFMEMGGINIVNSKCNDSEFVIGLVEKIKEIISKK